MTSSCSASSPRRWWINSTKAVSYTHLAEMASGFLPGKPSTPKPAGPDMSRNIAFAGWTVVQEVKGGSYAVTYDEDGYAVKAVKQ